MDHRGQLASWLACALAFPAHAANVNIIDGDTLSIDGTRIRIVEIDTPET